MSRMRSDGRQGALSGTGDRGGCSAEYRGSALWGKGGRRAVLALLAALLAAVVVPLGAAAPPTPPGPSAPPASGPQPAGPSAQAPSPFGAFVPDSLVQQAQANPDALFQVIVQGNGTAPTNELAGRLGRWAADADQTLQAAAAKAGVDLQNAQDLLATFTSRFDQAEAAFAAKAAKAGLTAKRADRIAAALAKVAERQAQAGEQGAQQQVDQANAETANVQDQFAQAGQQIVQQDVKDEFNSITGVVMKLSGRQLLQLTRHGNDGLLSITPDAPVQESGTPAGLSWSMQLWPYESRSANNWLRDASSSFAANVPSIAIVDSGIDSSRSDFGGRVIDSVDLSSIDSNNIDDSGHGTFVAGIAADSRPPTSGANPAANLVSVKVMDADGMGMTSDIINACQWILDNAAKDDIKVANFSLHSDITAPFYIDPLDRAVEQLWFHGITVVVAAGNYGTSSGPSGVIYSPSDDPFVITVGAADTDGSISPEQATMAPWSSWGYTVDGFAKPELSAPGRYMVGPVSPGAELYTSRASNVVANGYMQLSGTSFAAPVVAGAAANILAEHPDWTPDQVKGALMLSARGLQNLGNDAGGVGVIQAGEAVNVSNPPNPNAGLDQFVTDDTSTGTPVYSFDSASWNSTASSNASWNSVSWNSASWNSASWNSASWNSVSWNSASWNSASWNSASWNSASWNSVAATSQSLEQAALVDATTDTDLFTLTPDTVTALLSSDDAPDPSTLPPDLQPTTTTATTTTTTTTPATTTTGTTTTPATTTTGTTTTPTTTTTGTTTTPTTTTTGTTTTPAITTTDTTTTPATTTTDTTTTPATTTTTTTP